MQLIALAKDQVEKCLEANVEAELWNSDISEAQRQAIERELYSDEPTLKLLYTTPESVLKQRLLDALKVETRILRWHTLRTPTIAMLCQLLILHFLGADSVLGT